MPLLVLIINNFRLFIKTNVFFNMNADYLNEILASEGSHLTNISFKVSELVNHTNTLKADVRTAVEHGSIQFNPLLTENENLNETSAKLLTEMTALEEEIDENIQSELLSCSEELEGLSTSLKEVKLFLEILNQLLEISTLIKKAREAMDKKEFYSCAELVSAAQSLMKSNSEELKSIEIFRVLSQEVTLTYEQIMHEISEIWSNCIKINVKDNTIEDLTEINVAVNKQFCCDLDQILKASALLKSNSSEKKFSSILLNDVFKKVIMKKSKTSVNVDGDENLLFIQVSNGSNKPNYLEVFNSVKVIVEFLKSNLDNGIGGGFDFLTKIGSYIADDFADALIKDCLSETIPTSSDDLDKYKVVVENAEDFERTLQETGFLPKSSSSLLDYAKNINVLFANKFCQSYLHKARVIMKKDLHNSTKSEDVISDITVLPLSCRNVLKEKFNVQEDIFTFPKCQISKQAEELMTLVHSMMNEIQKSLDLCAVRLFFTVRNIFEMYASIVPLHHKKFLETLPHQIAIFHNNCMYFSYNLINLATQYYNKIPCILKDHFKIFLEEAVALRSLAAETLEIAVTNQRNQLTYILRDSGFATLNENPKLDPNSEKSIRQCIRQLQVLQTVWSDVLPLSVYNRAIGFLLDAIIEELISLIISVEDISSQTAYELVSSFTLILEKAPSLLAEAKEIHRHCRKWHKFQEFVLVLKGSLRDIDDRWANGMGPLAVEFTAEQVKHLIRALFQNSDRRANLLSRIR